MVTLSKPTAGDTDWATEVNDNWTTIEGAINQAICQGRLTLSSGNPSYGPAPQKPSSTDTVADTVDFSPPHRWTTGTMVTPVKSVGGLTSGTTYYINAIDADTVSFHTTLANAEAGTSKVDLTATIDVVLTTLGVAHTTLYFSPYLGNRIGLYDGSTWKIFAFSELSLSISSLTASKNYDIFLYDNSGTPTLEATAWTDGLVRATNLVRQDGIYVKSGSTTRRYLGTIRITATTGQCESSVAKRFVSNYYNRRQNSLVRVELASYWYLSSPTSYQHANGSSANKVELLSNGEDEVFMEVHVKAVPASGGGGVPGIGLDENHAMNIAQRQTSDSGGSTIRATATATLRICLSEGYHTLYWMEKTNAGYCYFYGSGGNLGSVSGMLGFCMD